MGKWRLIVAACVVAAELGIQCRVANAWLFRTGGIDLNSGFAFSPTDIATRVTVTSTGDVVAGGTLGIEPSFDATPIVTRIDGATGKELWRVVLGAAGGPPGFEACQDQLAVRALTLDPSEDVIAAGPFCLTGVGITFNVLKLTGASGAFLWDAVVQQTLGTGNARHADVDASGDVLAVGSTGDATTSTDFTAAKLAGGTGALLWQRNLDGVDSTDDPGSEATDFGESVAVDGAGDVVAAGSIEQLDGRAFAVMKFDGASGADVWASPVLVVEGFGSDVAVDAAGDVVASGAEAEFGASYPGPIAVVKLANATGAELWRTTLEDASQLGFPTALTVDPSGDVIVGGDLFGEMFVSRLAGATGTESWRFTLPVQSVVDRISEVAVDPDGNVIVAATLSSPAIIGDEAGLAALRLDGATGSLLTVYRVDGKPGTINDPGLHDWTEDLALGQDGRIVVAGALGNNEAVEGEPDFSVLQLADRLAGKALVVFDEGASSRLILRARDRNVFAGTPGGTGDPTAGGAVLELRNDGTAETASFFLPPTLWRSIRGAAPGVQAYKYSDGTGSAGPCRSVLVKSGKVLKAKCIGGLGGFTLDEAAQGALAMRLTLGSGAGAYCFEFGTATVDEPGRFKAVNGVPPAACD